MSKKASRSKGRTGRRVYRDELKAEAVQMLIRTCYLKTGRIETGRKRTVRETLYRGVA